MNEDRLRHKTIGTSEYRILGDVVGCIDSVDTNWICLNIWLPFRYWMEAPSKDRGAVFKAVVRKMYPDARIDWGRFFGSDALAVDGDLLLGNHGAVYFYPYSKLPVKTLSILGIKDENDQRTAIQLSE